MSIADKLKSWWAFREGEDTDDNDSPHRALREDQRRDAAPLLLLAFGWGFLITGLLVGGQLGNGMNMADALQASFLGNSVNFLIGALVGYIGYKTALNSGLLYRKVYGTMGAIGPVIFISLLMIGFQGIIVGAFGFAWSQNFSSGTFFAVAIFGGILFTATTYRGVKGLEMIAIPSTIVLIVVGLYAAYLNISQAGGWQGFLAMSEQSATKQPLTMVQAINIVIGSWIVGAIVMPEITRFAKKAWVAIAIPFVVLMVAQWFLQIIGTMGGVVSGSADFTTYMIAQGSLIGAIGVIAMSLALWTTGDTNLYLPAIQTSSVLRRPKRVTIVICGVIGTLLGLGIYQHFEAWIALLSAIVPPVIGPVLVDFYFTGRHHYDDPDAEPNRKCNISAYLAYAIGALSAYFTPDWMAKALVGLIASVIAYAVLASVQRVGSGTRQS